MENNKLISIGIPFYNSQNTLISAIKSVFAQTYQNWELLLVNDGSTDGSIDIAMSVKDSRVRVVDNKENKRLPYRLNQIADIANGDYVARMDADDMMFPSRIEEQVEFLHNNPKFDLVQTGICSIDSKGKAIGIRGCKLHPSISGSFIFASRHINHATIVAKKEWFQRNRYDPNCRIAQDLDLWCRAYSKGDFNLGHIAKPYYLVCEADSISIVKLLRAYRVQRSIIRRHGLDFGFSQYGLIKLLGHNYVKTFSQILLSILHLNSSVCVFMRNSKIGNVVKENINNKVEGIRSTKVPGLSGF
ncbi:MAG: glycosyltransferase family 2 protein [Candidatus Brocadiaceae bacterium]|nr:glycosyltransferase family 2 protein [Candidatus Brocadiaceae bacterium]